ncbi:DUF2969 domain-containing protein [Streptococcus zalophi]|uniref:DUF2969 domain-containing protein n=1 Tax=Streptococcus zalophi TaxID=640031 RepID=A0A934P9C1_9STRE|nr:DUF2969 domain-containing protein [Streptococcus zalophi]MBJ8349541.1 DUF2969 domain-containing protein [Streptococcus zalophi]MCR8967255.1 DUF2969 domain-containing protein [Streptococcus zalophi]
MSKKDKKITVEIVEGKVNLSNSEVNGFQLKIGRKVIGSIVEMDEKFAVVQNNDVLSFHKSMDLAVSNIIEKYNLNH